MDKLLHNVAIKVKTVATLRSNYLATNRRMDTPGKRLAAARAAAGFRSARAAAIELEVPVSTYNAHERAGEPGARMYKIETARKYARAFTADYIWLLTGEKANGKRRGLPGEAERALDILSDLRGEDLQFALRHLSLFAEHFRGKSGPASDLDHPEGSMLPKTD